VAELATAWNAIVSSSRPFEHEGSPFVAGPRGRQDRCFKFDCFLFARKLAAMSAIQVVWDMEDDDGGNVQHVAEHGVEPSEVEEVLFGSLSNTTSSKSSSHRITFGYTEEGRYLAVIWSMSATIH
jgi:hypothetical protein